MVLFLTDGDSKFDAWSGSRRECVERLDCTSVYSKYSLRGARHLRLFLGTGRGSLSRFRGDDARKLTVGLCKLLR